MGFLDSLKKATGVGLNASEHYQRAFEKGVLLGPTKFGDAARLFDTAAQKAHESGDSATAARSSVNAKLYAYLCTGSPSTLVELRRALDEVDEFEVIGSRTEMLPADALRTELDGRIQEMELGRINSAHHAHLADAHLRASETFRNIASWNLVTYKHHFQLDPHIDQGQSRFFYHLGLSGWHAALDTVSRSPDAAAEQMSRAHTSFRQCRDDPWAQRAHEWLARCRQKRTCWFCHRELQGAGIHFRTFSAAVSSYLIDRVAELGQDGSSIDAAAGVIVLCQPCGSALERAADRISAEHVAVVRREVDARLSELSQALQSLAATVQVLAARR